MSHPTVDKIRVKITRAEQHIQDFDLGLKAFRDTNPYSDAAKEDAERGKRIYYVAKVDPVPDELAAIAADVLQNLRAVLDQIAYQLVLAENGGSPPAKGKVYFPISGSAAYYETTRKGAIKGVRQAVVDAIDATQPYKGGKGHVLWQLSELAKPDRHQILVSAGSMYGGVDIASLFVPFMPQMKALLGQKVLRPADKLVPLKVGDELLIGDLNMNIQPRFAFDVSFYAPGIIEGEPALKTLKDMANLVRSVVDALEPLFP